ncbi:MAG: mandelate racemase/muconate lactonizing enzyme family protein, partial [Actinomycetes bacterium]
MDSDDELAIVRVRTFLLRKNLTKEMRISRGGFTVREHALVELTTKSGLTGLGEGIGNARSIFHLMKNTVAPVALKWSARDPNGWLSYWSRIPTYFEGVGAAGSSVSAFEIAMWDIKGKFFDAPCSELLGGRVREEIPAYASDVYWQSSVDEMRRDAARILSLGFMRIKAHLGVDPPKEETKRVAGLRKEVGEEVDLMIDLN